jgi:hypothetical protein
MTRHNDSAFLDRLLAPMLGQLQRIVSAARGECSLDELKAEAWIAAEMWRIENGANIEPEDRRLQENVLLNLWRSFGRFANRTMRAAFRLDHEDIGRDGEPAMNTIAATLAVPEDYEPEKVLESLQDEAANNRCLVARFAEAVAWLCTLEHFDHDLPAIACYLSIPVATLKRRLDRAEHCAACQPSMFDGITAIPGDFHPKRVMLVPRRFRRQAMRRICHHVRPWQAHLFFAAGQVFQRR